MPRSPRLDHPGARHHVMNRGARRASIFLTDADCGVFLGLLADLPARFGVVVHGWALMGNHFHLLLSTPRGNLAEAMGFLQSRYARHLNCVHAWDGPVFRGRYQNRIVEDEPYWRHLLAYVHLNPVRAHLVGSPEDATWTSHRAYLGLERRPDWLDTGEHLAFFGSSDALRQYVWEVQVGRERGPQGFDAERLWVRDPSLPVAPPSPEQPRRTPEQALVEVCEVTGRSPDSLWLVKRGPGGNPAQWLAIWWLAEGASLGTNTIARQLGLDAAQVSRTLRKVRRSTEPEMEGWKRRLQGERFNSP